MPGSMRGAGAAYYFRRLGNQELRAGLAALIIGVSGTHGAAKADDSVTGIPEDSIALGYADPVRAALARYGIVYGASYTGEIFHTLAGGQSQGFNVDGLVNVYSDIDLAKLVGWQGAAFHVDAFYIHGDGPSTRRIGNIFAVTNIEALEGFRLNELWLEQALLDDKVKVRLGSLAADTEFFVSDAAGQFLNGTFGWPGITATNMTQGGPGYPLTSMGVRVEVNPTENLKILSGFFNASPADPDADDPQIDNRHGTDFRFGDGLLMMIEGQFSYGTTLNGVLKVGGWKQFNDDFADFVTEEVEEGSSGMYAIVDQTIWKGSDDSSVVVFGRISASSEQQNLMDFYFDTGIVFTGLVDGRPSDSFGVAYAYGNISDRFVERQVLDGETILSSHEAAIEFNYTAQLMPGWTITPDAQYIWNPGGRVADPERPGQRVENAFELGVRTTLSY